MSKDKKLALSEVEGLIPVLRFPEFEHEGEWKSKSIEELCEILNNIRKPISSSNRKKGDYPYYGASGIIDFVDDYLFDERLLLIGEDGAKWGAYESTAFLVDGKYWVNNHAHVLKPNLIDEKLLESYLVKLDLHPYITGAAPPKLTLGKLKEIPVPVPKNPQEQQKIASCLSSLDEVIAAHSQKLELLKEHKKGLMQNLFPQSSLNHDSKGLNDSPDYSKVPKYRFPEFIKKSSNQENQTNQGSDNGDWVENKLGEVCKMQAGKFVSASEIKEQTDVNLFPCYGGNGLRGYTNSFNHSGTYSLIGRQGALCGNVTLVEGDFYATEHAVVVTPETNVDTLLLYYILELLNLNQYATGQAQPGLSVSNLEQVELYLPKNPKEQQKIASCLSSLDALITAKTEKIEQLKLHKKGLMQGLFPKIQD